MSTPVDAGLRLITHQLGVSAALLFAADATGALRLAAAVGSWRGEEAAIQGLAERLGGGAVDVLDVTDAIEGARFAAGARLGEGEGALLVLDPRDRAPDGEWSEAFATSSLLALGLVRSMPGAYDLGRLFHEVAVHPGTFDDRLGLALRRATEALGLDGAAFALVAGGEWTPQAVYDPSGHLVPLEPLALDQTFCAITTQSDGPFVVEDASQMPVGPDAPGAYVGAPVFVQGRCVGTFCAVARAPRARPFSDDDRALIEALARWVGTAVEGAAARTHADRAAALAAFFDGAPLGMGVALLLDGDLEFVRVNTTAAAALGATPEALVGRRASGLGLDEAFGRHWLAACRRAVTERAPQRFEITAGPPDRLRPMATTVSHIGGADGEAARIAFVVDADLADRRSPIEALLSDAPLALFAADPGGRLVMSGGRGLDVLGLSLGTARGRPLVDVFADAPEAAPGIADALAGLDAAWLAQIGDRAFEIRVQGRPGPDGTPGGLIGVALDITGHHGATSLTAEAEARKTLLKHLQHEIRSPLTSILGYAELLEEHPTPDDLAEVREVIERAGERLMAALDEMTLLGGDAPASTPVPIEPCTMLIRAAEESRTAAEARRLSLNLWCTLPDEPILMDAALFERLLRTLISGAVATAAGTIDVRMRIADASALEIVVTGGAPGTAFGLPEAYVPRLAEALGGRARTLDGDESGWSVRLPRHRAPVMEWPVAETSDGARGEAPAMAFAEDAA